MSLYLFDFGRFDNLAHALDSKREYKGKSAAVDGINQESQNNNESHSKDDETDDYVPAIIQVCHGHQHKVQSTNRRMSVPQLSRNQSVSKVREQRITSVVGIPHRHHITIAVNDEPVDIIKTTCTGPCLQSCNANTQVRKTPSVKNQTYQNHFYSDSRNKHKTTNIIILTLIYVISTLCVRSVITLYATLLGTTAIQRKVSLFLTYLFSAIGILSFSLNPFTDTKTSLFNRLKLITSLALIILWSGLHLVPTLPWPLTIFTAIVLGIGISLFWNCHVELLLKWSYNPLSHAQVQSINEVVTRSNILPTTMVISHSMHIWSSILVFVLLEALSTNIFFKRKSSIKSGITGNASTLEEPENVTNICGIINDDSNKGKWRQPDQTMFYLQYICISLNIVALVLVVLLLDKSRSIRIPSNSIDKDTSHSMISRTHNELPTFLESNDVDGNLFSRSRNHVLNWGKNKSNIMMQLWNFHKLKYVFPSLFSMGLVEGFFITDYNERFINCFQKASFIGISMLTFSISPVVFVNIFQLIIRHPSLEIFTSPLSRLLLLLSSLILSLTNVGHHWSYLLIFYPSVVALDAMICLSTFYANVANISGHLADNSIVLHRLLRLLGVAMYVLISCVSGSFVASVITVTVHCIIGPAIVLMATYRKDHKI